MARATPHIRYLVIEAAQREANGEAVPLHRQVYETFRRGILGGDFPPGSRLPSTRQLSSRLSIARSTVEEAYGQLETEGYVETRRGSGTFVASELVVARANEPILSQEPSPLRLSNWGLRAAKEEFVRPSSEPGHFRYDLRPHVIAADRFPWHAWQESISHALRWERSRLEGYPPVLGDGPLREAIARHIDVYRGVSCHPDQLVIVNGAQQALHLISQLVVRPGDHAVVEDPGYPPARVIFEASGLKVDRAPVDADGMLVDELPRNRIVHVTPSHQHPTGVTLSLSRRLRLLEMADRCDALIIEDDYDSEFRYEGRPVESLHGLDRHDRVIYLGTFSKSLLPSLRIAFVVLPQPLVPILKAAKSLTDGGTATLDQVALDHFLRKGGYERHIRRMRRIYRQRRDSLVSGLRQVFGHRATIGEAKGGLSVLVRLDVGLTEEAIVARAAERGIGLRGSSSYYRDPPAIPSFVLGFGALPPTDIESAVRCLAEALAV